MIEKFPCKKEKKHLVFVTIKWDENYSNSAHREPWECNKSRVHSEVSYRVPTVVELSLISLGSTLGKFIDFFPLAIFPISFCYKLQIAKQWKEIKTQKAHQVNGGKWLEFSATGVTSAWRKKSVTSREKKLHENSVKWKIPSRRMGDFSLSAISLCRVWMCSSTFCIDMLSVQWENSGKIDSICERCYQHK